LAIVFAVVALYVLDFALNGMQASVRNLLLDLCPPEQLSVGNAWQARFTHTGNIIGYAIGGLRLEQMPIVRLLGGSQFRKFCIIAEVILIVTVYATCTMKEKKRETSLERQGAGQLSQAITNISSAITKLPKPIRRVCFVQMFAFMGWYAGLPTFGFILLSIRPQVPLLVLLNTLHRSSHGVRTPDRSKRRPGH
jgi:solute carrier family 45 protein 1/2/4